LLPVFCVPLPAWPQLVRRAPRLRGLVPLALVAWALAAAVVARPPLGEFRRVRLMATGQIELQAAGIVDGRRHTLSLATSSHPVSADDELLWQPALVPGHYEDGTTAPVLGRLPGRSVVGAFALGRVGYRLPLDVWVYDRHGLADPVVAHVGTEERGVPGHEKALSPTWVAAEWVDPSVEVDPATFAVVPGLTSWLLSVPAGAPMDAAGFDAEREAAAAALGCGKLDDVRDSARQPLTPSRFFGNLVDAVRLDGFRFPADPVAAQAALC
jgi:hypothetical protein